MSVFTAADMLVPREDILKTWPVIACDQFTSQMEYWKKVEEEVGDKPSALRLIFPEVYLSMDMDGRIRDINREMEKVLSAGILEKYPDSFVYVERTLLNGQIRRGLVGAVDLEDYSFAPDADTAIRATERTVPERIPPRVRIRENAALELSHVLLFADDPEDSILGSLEKKKHTLPCLYALDLMAGGGHLEGYAVTGDEAAALTDLIQAYEEKRKAGKINPVLYLVGDGNHSLATAKTCYENLKKQGADADRLKKARYAMVEMNNVRDTSVQFEPIHRLVTGVEPEAFLKALEKRICSDKGYEVRWTMQGASGTIHLNPALGQLPVGILQKDLDSVMDNPEKLDYIHGEDSLRSLSEKTGNLGFELPPISKDAFFDAIEKDGVLPRKTFSIGHAQEKRYYLEARQIR